MENKFSIGGREFSLSKLDAFKQFHIVRRVGPILTELLPHLSSLTTLKNDVSDPEKLEQLGRLATPILEGLARLSDDDADYVLHNLLSSVQVKQTHGNWATLYANGGMMINDLDLPVLMQCAGRAFVFNLSGFFAALPQ